MMESGKKVKKKEKVFIIIQMGIFMMGSLKMGKKKEIVVFIILS